MKLAIIILSVIVLVLVCIMIGFSCALREKYNELFVTSQQLVDVVKDIDGDLTGRRYCYYANLINSSQLKDYDSSLNSVVDDLKREVTELKEADNNKKELEMIAERKERMADYLMIHPSDSINNLAEALYDIASGKTEGEE